jgi:hypothetical protein
VFLLTVLFGLWHGLFVMPVLLSIIGPLTGGGHADPAAPAIESPPPPPSEDKAGALPVISTLGGALTQQQAPPSLTYKGGFVFGKFSFLSLSAQLGKFYPSMFCLSFSIKLKYRYVKVLYSRLAFILGRCNLKIVNLVVSMNVTSL